MDNNIFQDDYDYMDILEDLDNRGFSDEYAEFIFRQVTNRYVAHNEAEMDLLQAGADFMNDYSEMELADGDEFHFVIPEDIEATDEACGQIISIVLDQLDEKGVLNMQLLNKGIVGGPRPSSDQEAIDRLNKLFRRDVDNEDDEGLTSL